MHTIPNTMPLINIARIDLSSARGEPVERLPHYITMPLIGLTSVGLWVLIYKAGCGIVAMIS